MLARYSPAEMAEHGDRTSPDRETHPEKGSAMSLWLFIAVHWLHVFFGIFWFGSRLVVTFVLLPTMRKVSQANQRVFLGELIRHFVRIEPTIGFMTLALGLLRGTVFGEVTSPSIAFGTTYGLTWTVALALGAAIAVLGGIIGRNFISLDSIKVTDDGSSQVAFDRRLGKTERYSRVSLALFLLIFTCMILMRFGF
ncbi:MAG TPA: hypothetical protein VFU60_20575 [Ktedonobacterales bacterium]|nr:hypothetical protein [Ktedonobacterales bacterium]